MYETVGMHRIIYLGMFALVHVAISIHWWNTAIL